MDLAAGPGGAPHRSGRTEIIEPPSMRWYKSPVWIGLSSAPCYLIKKGRCQKMLCIRVGSMWDPRLYLCGILDSNSCASRVVTVLSLSEAEPLKALVGLFGAVAAGAIMDHGVQLTQGCRQQSECRHEST